jgi:methylglutaconyl-CoA hydratase
VTAHHSANAHAPLAPGGSVSVVEVDGVADICFGHPKSNSLPASVLRGLADAVAEASARADVRAMVVRSYGSGAFCAGASFDELAAIRDATQGKEFFMGFARVIGAMISAPKPIVARVHGKAVGGGVGIVAAADYSIAVSAASVRLSELAVGIGPFVVGPAIERKIGTGAFGAMAIDADWRDAAWAERHGLYSRVVDDAAALDAELDRRVASLAAANPEAVAGIKRAVWGDVADWPALLERRAETSGTLVLSEFTKAAIGKFGNR